MIKKKQEGVNWDKVEKDRTLTAKDIFKDPLLNRNSVSNSTIKNFLNEKGFKARVKKKIMGISIAN